MPRKKQHTPSLVKLGINGLADLEFAIDAIIENLASQRKMSQSAMRRCAAFFLTAGDFLKEIEEKVNRVNRIMGKSLAEKDPIAPEEK